MPVPVVAAAALTTPEIIAIGGLALSTLGSFAGGFFGAEEGKSNRRFQANQAELARVFSREEGDKNRKFSEYQGILGRAFSARESKAGREQQADQFGQQMGLQRTQTAANIFSQMAPEREAAKDLRFQKAKFSSFAGGK